VKLYAGVAVTASAGTVAGSATPWTVGAVSGSSTTVGIIQDFVGLSIALCQTYGTCCYTSNCNSAENIKINFILLFLAIFFSKIYF